LSAGRRRERNMVELARRKKKLDMRRKKEKGEKRIHLFFLCVFVATS
jgi:hypothetical protein